MFEINPFLAAADAAAGQVSGVRRTWWRATLASAVLALTLTVATGGCAGDAKKQEEDGSGSKTTSTVPKFAYEVGAGFVNVFPVDAGTGSFGTVAQNLFGVPAVLSANTGVITPNQKYLYLGLTTTQSQVSGFAIDATTGLLTSTAQGRVDLDTANDTVPFKMVTDPAGKFLYVLNEKVGSPSISAFTIDDTTGALTEVVGSPYASAASLEDLAMHPSGKFLYVAGGIAAPTANVLPYAIDSTSGQLTLGTGAATATNGSFPFSIALDPQGKHLYAMEIGTNEVTVFSILSTDGSLTKTANSPFAITGSGNPSSLTVQGNGTHLFLSLAPAANALQVMNIASGTGDISPIAQSPYSPYGGASGDIVYTTVDPSGKFLYVASSLGTKGIDGFRLDATTGQLSHISTFPVAGGNDTTILITSGVQ